MGLIGSAAVELTGSARPSGEHDRLEVVGLAAEADALVEGDGRGVEVVDVQRQVRVAVEGERAAGGHGDRADTAAAQLGRDVDALDLGGPAAGSRRGRGRAGSPPSPRRTWPPTAAAPGPRRPWWPGGPRPLAWRPGRGRAGRGRPRTRAGGCGPRGARGRWGRSATTAAPPWRARRPPSGPGTGRWRRGQGPRRPPGRRWRGRGWGRCAAARAAPGGRRRPPTAGSVRTRSGRRRGGCGWR